MKAIRTYRLGQTNHKPARIVATTGERGQRRVYSVPLVPYDAHVYAVRRLAEEFKWAGPFIGGGFPDGSMVWVFNTPHNKARA